MNIDPTLQGALDSQASAQNKQLQLQQIAEEKKQQIQEPLSLLGSELLRSGAGGIGKYLSKKTGIKAFENLGDAVSKDGIEKGFTNTLSKAKDEAVSKGTAKANQAVAEVEKKAKDVKKVFQQKLDDTKGKASQLVDDTKGKATQLVDDTKSKVTKATSKLQRDYEVGKQNALSKKNKLLGDQKKQFVDKDGGSADLGNQDEFNLQQAKNAQLEQAQKQYLDDLDKGQFGGKGKSKVQYERDLPEEDDSQSVYDNLRKELGSKVEGEVSDINPATGKAPKPKGKSVIEKEVGDDPLFDEEGNVSGDYDFGDELTRKYQSQKLKSLFDPKPVEKDESIDFNFKQKRITESEFRKANPTDAEKFNLPTPEELEKEPTAEQLSNPNTNLQSDIEKLDPLEQSEEKFKGRLGQVKSQLEGLGEESKVSNVPKFDQPDVPDVPKVPDVPDVPKVPTEGNFESVFQDYKPQQTPDFLQSTRTAQPKPVLADQPELPRDLDIAEDALGSKAETVEASKTLTAGFQPNKPTADVGEAVGKEAESKGISSGLAEGAGEVETLGGGPEDPIADVISAGLGIASLFSGLFGKSHHNSPMPTLQSSFQQGVSETGD